jgi:hypothetical protein
MTTASQTSNASSASARRDNGRSAKGSSISKGRTPELIVWAQREYGRLAPPHTRIRKREAQRWLDEVDVLSMNGRCRDRIPGVRLVSVGESRAIYEDAFATLRTQDPALAEAVYAITTKRWLDDLGQTLEEWKAQVAKGRPRRSRVWRRILADRTFRARLRQLRPIAPPP